MGSGPSQQPSQHSVNVNLNDFFGHANVHGKGQEPMIWNPGDHPPPAPFPANAAAPPAFPFTGSGTEANCAQQASGGHGGEHGGPGAQTGVGV